MANRSIEIQKRVLPRVLSFSNDDGIRFMRLKVERHWNYNIWTVELGVIQNSR